MRLLSRSPVGSCATGCPCSGADAVHLDRLSWSRTLARYIVLGSVRHTPAIAIEMVLPRTARHVIA
jgi:hypothetical protein